MATILEELRTTYQGRLQVVFIDLRTQIDAEKHEISTIPTQIFFDATGKELFRHEGFFSREEILAKWRTWVSNSQPARSRKQRRSRGKPR